jgi:hypothetical protein
LVDLEIWMERDHFGTVQHELFGAGIFATHNSRAY